jgi:hypothetical protein
MEKILVQYTFPNSTTKQYDKVNEELRSLGLEHPDGLIYHVGAQKGNNLIVCEVWESERALNKMRDTLVPVLNRNGVPSNIKPEITNVHYEFSGVLEHH